MRRRFSAVSVTGIALAEQVSFAQQTFSKLDGEGERDKRAPKFESRFQDESNRFILVIVKE